jgi:hypothetical protein
MASACNLSGIAFDFHGETWRYHRPTKRIKLEPLQWVSGYLVASDHGAVFRPAISGSRAKIVGETKARASSHRRDSGFGHLDLALRAAR